MNVAEWILVAFLSLALLVFLIVSIILLVKLIELTKEAQKIVVKGQDIAAKADDVVDNVKDMTSIGGVVKTFSKKILETEDKKETKKTKNNSR
ncbi:hypothetical protein IJI70_02490 [Candidatus Saccharibacteria bacterium]|nr:hypothetical protein [Candidatus Saccharibacteria bacterium]